MDQKEYTDYIIPRLIDRFPQFKDLCTFKPGDIVDIDIKSKQGKLIFWVTTQDKEITVGFTGDTDCDWHTHMSLFGANMPDEELNVAIDFIDSIINDKRIIIHSTTRGYFVNSDIDCVNRDKKKDESITTYYWSNL